MKGKGFVIASLLAAGFIPPSSPAQEADNSKTLVGDDITEIVSSITDEHRYILTGHRSHSSHRSHGSHRSYMAPPSIPPDFSSKRNEMSTPRSSILPLSYGVMKKVNTLPGNSGKFKKIILNVQVALHIKGYEVGSVDGRLHAETVAALYKYQIDRGMVPSGKVTHQVLDSLGIVAQ